MDEFGDILKQFGDIEVQTRSILNAVSYESNTTSTYKVATILRNAMTAAHKTLRDFTNEDNAVMQSVILENSIRQLNKFRQAVLDASEASLFSPADVAQITAKVDLLLDRLS